MKPANRLKGNPKDATLYIFLSGSNLKGVSYSEILKFDLSSRQGWGTEERLT
jgi:hypothetical protein